MATLPTETTAKTDAINPTSEPEKPKWRIFKDQAEICKNYRTKLIANWGVSVDYRRGKPFSSQTDEDRVSTNLDWSLTIAKQSQLFSQVPTVFINHPPTTTSDDVMPWLHDFQSRINDYLRVAGVESAMFEILPDAINAAGFGVVMVSRETITQEVEIPAVNLSVFPPELQQQILQTGMLPNGTPVPMEMVPDTIDSRYVVQRVSPKDFLWPIDFTGSDFDNAPWIGRSGRISWAEAKQRFNLTEDDKRDVIGEDRNFMNNISHDVERERALMDEQVAFDEIFYKEFSCTPDAQSFHTIRHLVFVKGKKKPVIDEPWKGQDIDEETRVLIGALRYPIRVLTLVYMTDEPLPPSDSAIGRAQVNELNKSRTQIIMQRERSLPLRTANVNYIDPIVLHGIMQGKWQHVIPVQGGGQVIQEVTTAKYPPENFAMDKVIKGDLLESWRVGPEPGVDGPAVSEQSPMGSMRTRIGMDRARVASFFCSIAEVLGGLICLYEPRESFKQGFTPLVSRSLGYSVLADSTVLLDTQQRLKVLKDFLDLSAKSGWMDIEAVLREIATLSGLDPAVVIREPQPAPPPAPNISLRLTGTEDMMNPLTLAFMDVAGMVPTLEQIEKMKELIAASVTPPAGAMIAPPGMMPGAAPPGMPGEPPYVPQPIEPNAPPPPAPGDANPTWTKLPHLDKRKLDRGEEEIS